MKYFGDSLVADDSLLRKLPNAVTREERMRIDSLVMCADVIRYNWHALTNAASEIANQIDNPQPQYRVALLSASWGIVERLDSIRQLISGLKQEKGKVGPNTTALLEALKPIREMRNHLNHLNGRLQNLSKAKGNRNALFGSFSFLHCIDFEKGPSRIITVQSGLIHGGESFPVTNPAGREIAFKYDLFTLSAAEKSVDLGNVIAILKCWLSAQEERWAKQLQTQIEAVAVEKRIEPSKLWEHSGGGFITTIEMQPKRPNE